MEVGDQKKHVVERAHLRRGGSGSGFPSLDEIKTLDITFIDVFPS